MYHSYGLNLHKRERAKRGRRVSTKSSEKLVVVVVWWGVAEGWATPARIKWHIKDTFKSIAIREVERQAGGAAGGNKEILNAVEFLHRGPREGRWGRGSPPPNTRKTKANHSGFCPGINLLAYSNAISLL